MEGVRAASCGVNVVRSAYRGSDCMDPEFRLRVSGLESRARFGSHVFQHAGGVPIATSVAAAIWLSLAIIPAQRSIYHYGFLPHADPELRTDLAGCPDALVMRCHRPCSSNTRLSVK